MKIVIAIAVLCAAMTGYFFTRPSKQEKEARESMGSWEEVWMRRLKRGK